MRLNAQNHSDSNAWTDPSTEECTTNAVSSSSRTFQFYDGRMPSLLDARDYELDGNRVFASRFKTGDFVIDSEIDIHGDSSAEGLMWTILIVPVHEERNFSSDAILTQRNDYASGDSSFMDRISLSTMAMLPYCPMAPKRCLIFLGPALHHALRSFETN